jgi:hypothetical protein
MGQVSIFLKQEIGQKLRYHLSIFPEWRLDPLILKNRFLIAILHLFSVETAYELSLTYIINQTITKSDIRI